MPQHAQVVLMVMGGVFALLGILAILWGRREEKGYYDARATRPDTREFLEHWPQHPQFGALKVGGWIAIALGVPMLIAGGALWLWG